MKKLSTCTIFIIYLASVCVSTSGEGVLKKPTIYYLHVDSEIKYRFSKTIIKSKVVNPSTAAQEALFDVTLPNEAFMTAFKLIIKNTEYHGKVKEKEEAKKEYQEAKRKGQSAGHIVAKPRETNKFQIQVNVAATEKVTFELTYRELLKRTRGTYEHVVYINPGQIVDDFKVEVHILESRNLTSIKVPKLRNDILTEDEKGVNDIAMIERITPKEARISYAPSKDQQKAMSAQGVSGQFVVEYDIDRQIDAGDILVMDGYFVHFVAPEGLAPMPMDIVFVLDRSGSMSGTKIQQLQESMVKILDDVKETDRIMLIAFNSRLEYWRKELASATRENIKDAKSFIKSTKANGGTDIDKGMTAGLKLLSKLTNEGHAAVLVFLTDGQPTSGETRTSIILENIKKFNERNIPIFSLAFGKGADYDFVKKVAAQNNGVGRKIYEDSDAALQITGFYKEISTILMKDVTFTYLDGALNDSTVTKTHFNTYFRGSELVVAGKINDEKKLQLGMEISYVNSKNTTLKLRFPRGGCIIPPFPILPPIKPIVKGTKSQNSGMMEKLWAYLTIKQLLTKKDALDSQNEIKNINQKILKMSLQYQFVTPLTSMVVTLPDELKKESTVTYDTEEKSDAHSLLHGTKFSSRVYHSPISSSIKRLGSSSRSSYKPVRNIIHVPSYARWLSRGTVGSRVYHSPISSIQRHGSSSISSIKPFLKMFPSSLPQFDTMKQTSSTGSRQTLRKRKRVKKKKDSSRGRKKYHRKIIAKSTVPSIVVKIPGITTPLCYDLPTKPNTKYNMLSMNSTDKVLNFAATWKENKRGSTIKVFRSASFKMDDNITQSAALIITQTKGTNFSMKREVDGISFSIHDTPIGLQILAMYSKNITTQFQGLLSIHIHTQGTVVKEKTKGKRTTAKIKLNVRKKKLRLRAKKTVMWNAKECWFLNQRMVNKLKINLMQYEM